MSVSAEIYLVVSLMFAVFAAVAAVGTSIVLGVGFERLRAGFEVVRKQTGFFAEAIHKLDHKAKELDEKNGKLEVTVEAISDTVHRVDKQTGFFAGAIQDLEQKIEDVKSGPSMPVEKTASDQVKENVSNDINLTEQSWITASCMDMDAPDTKKLLEGACMIDYLAQKEDPQSQSIEPELAQMPVGEPLVQAEASKSKPGLSQFLGSYFKGEDRTDGQKIVYH